MQTASLRLMALGFRFFRKPNDAGDGSSDDINNGSSHEGDHHDHNSESNVCESESDYDCCSDQRHDSNCTGVSAKQVTDEEAAA